MRLHHPDPLRRTHSFTAMWWSIPLNTENTWCEYDTVLAGNSVYSLIHYLVLTTSLESRWYGSHLTDGEAVPKQQAQAAQFIPAESGFRIALSAPLALPSQVGSSHFASLWSPWQLESSINHHPLPHVKFWCFCLLAALQDEPPEICLPYVHLNILC